jgi:hypothetical protein
MASTIAFTLLAGLGGGCGSSGGRTRRRRAPHRQTEKKYYVPGVGEIEERVVKGHHEQFQLVSVTH